MFKDTMKASGWVIGFGALAIVLVIIFSAMAIFGFGFFQRGTADFRGETDAIEKTRADGDFRIAAYNHFFDLCSSVQADEDRITALETELEDPNTSDKRAEQVRASLTAVRASRAEKVREYNADAAKDFTVGQFRDSDLPYKLDIDEEETECVV